MPDPTIQSEYSAQARSAAPNPALTLALNKLKAFNGLESPRLRIADQGCGQLRHLPLLLPIASQLYLVDTERQLTTFHRDGRSKFSVVEVAQNLAAAGSQVVALPSESFATSRLGLDLVCCVAVMDVVPAELRAEIIRAAARNLRSGGHLVLVVPRNDASILRRCTADRRYNDGFLFRRPGKVTFYRNFVRTDPLVRLAAGQRLRLVADLSTYRQLTMILVK